MLSFLGLGFTIVATISLDGGTQMTNPPGPYPFVSDVSPEFRTDKLKERTSRDMFIIDFGCERTEQEAAQFEKPFEYVLKNVRPDRKTNKRAAYRLRWWLHVEPRPAMRAALAGLSRFVITPTVAKHRVFAWAKAPTLPDHQLFVFAREDDYFFGVVHSRVHEAWALKKGTRLETRPRYTPTSTFETFPFPWPLNTPDEDLTAAQRKHRDAIAAAGKALDDQRGRWLNPPELVREEPDIVAVLPSRLVPVSPEAGTELKKRTLVKLYNAKPAWLTMLHEALNRVVLAAYGFADGISDADLFQKVLKLNHERGKSPEVMAMLHD